MKKVSVIGGGLGGLISAILLARKDFQVTLFEKKSYPFHRVCGEYISNEVLGFLKREKLFPKNIETPTLTEFMFSSTNGDWHKMPLDLGGFGISRFTLDAYLAKKAIVEGVNLLTQNGISEVSFHENFFELTDSKGEKHTADFVIGAYGKQSHLDKKLDRAFTSKEAPYIGVKYHIKTDFPKNLIALHNFEGGYCGVSAIENDRYNMCYLGLRSSLKKYGDIPSMEEATLWQNPFLKELFNHSEFLFEKPEVINAFAFHPKGPLENHIFMVGDSAGLITPLCGNGMAIAIHSAKILTETLSQNMDKQRAEIEAAYANTWHATFGLRLKVGRATQKLFGTGKGSSVGVKLLKNSKIVSNFIMKNTHGQPF